MTPLSQQVFCESQFEHAGTPFKTQDCLQKSITIPLLHTLSHPITPPKQYTVGSDEGSDEGSDDGLILGTEDGFNDGKLLGTGVGSLLGSLLGTHDGLVLGADDGLLDG